jgi:PTS system cellobiose-specific IIC component
MGWLERILTPIATSVGKNKYLLTIRDSFAMIMPLLIIGSMFTLVANFPIPARTDLLQSIEFGDYALKELIGIPSNATMGLMGIFIAFNVGYNLAGHEGIADRASAGIVSLSSWLILMPQVTPFTPEGASEALLVDSLPLGWLGARGVFVALIMGILSVKLYAAVVRREWTIEMPEGVPPTVSRAFSALIPMAVTFSVVWVVRMLFALTPWEDVFTFIYSLLQMPLQALGATVWAQTLIYLFAHLLWFFGIHGTSVTDSVYQPILISLSAENLAATNAGQVPPNIINYQFETLFATFGGAGSTISLIIAALLVCRSERITRLMKLSIGPGVFEINEPITFGLPIVMNPVMFIPFLLVPTINILATYAVMAAGLVPPCSGVMLPWTTPPIVSGFLTSGWQGAVWQAVLIAVGAIVYMPFMRILDREYLSEEREAQGGEAEEEDELDLGSLGGEA